MLGYLDPCSSLQVQKSPTAGTGSLRNEHQRCRCWGRERRKAVSSFCYRGQGQPSRAMGCCFSPPRSTSLEDLAAYSKGGALKYSVGPDEQEQPAPAIKCARSSGAVSRSSRAAQDLTPMAEEPHATPFKAQCGCAQQAVEGRGLAALPQRATKSAARHNIRTMC